MSKTKPKQSGATITARASTARNAVGAHNLEVQYRPIAGLRPYPRNARRHSPKQIQQIAASITTFGFTNPILIDDAGMILAGHGRVEAAKLLGHATVPTIRLAEMTEAQKRAYILADNRLAELAKWDPEILATELEFLTSTDLGFEVEVTGFETQAIDLALAPATHAPADPKADALPPLHEGPAVARAGDLWILGQHRLLCADARDGQSFVRVMDGRKAQLVITDPPYNVRIAGHAQGLGRVKHRDFAMASGEMSAAAFTRFLSDALGNCVAHSTNGSIHFVFMDWRHMREVLAAGDAVYSELKNVCVWNKDNAGMGSFYRSKHELVFVFKNGTKPHINNFGLGDGGRYRTNVWDYAGLNSLKRGRDDELEMHPTVKPVALIADAIKDCSQRSQIVLDPFMGSGTTIIAAEKSGRRAFGIELDPAYVDVAIRRYQAFAGIEAVNAETGETFAQTAERRAGASADPVPAPGPARKRARRLAA
jgi:DNA modification methylase